MVRGMMVVLTLAATAAQAQEATKAAEGAKRVALPKEEPPATVLVARSAQEPSLGTSSPGEGTLDNSTDCSFVQGFRRGRVPVVRTYPPPLPAQTGKRRTAPEQTSYVAAIAQCGHLYIFQIRSKSKDAWEAKRARLEASTGETLQVNAFFFDHTEWGRGIHTIVAAVPPGKNVTKLKITLTSEDGRALSVEARDLP